MNLPELDARFAHQLGWKKLPDRSLLKISGPDRIKFLHSLTTNDVKSAKVGSFQKSCLLTNKGKLLAEFHLMFFEDFLWLETGQKETVLETLKKFRLASRVEFEDISDNFVQVVFIGENLSVIQPNLIAFENMFCMFSKTVFVPPAALLESEFIKSVAFEISETLLETLRISAGIPKFGQDVSDATLIKEVPCYEAAISYTKGCYPGQETVARLHSRGDNVAKKLFSMVVDEAADLTGAAIFLAQEHVSEVTSSVSYGQKTFTLGMVPRAAFEKLSALTLRKNDRSYSVTVNGASSETGSISS